MQSFRPYPESLLSLDDGNGLVAAPRPAVAIVLEIFSLLDPRNKAFFALSQVSPPWFRTARCLMFFNAVQCWLEIPAALIALDSSSHPSTATPSPNTPLSPPPSFSDTSFSLLHPCSTDELRAISSQTPLLPEQLSGDWVLLDFIGGYLQYPIIIKKLPRPPQYSSSFQPSTTTPPSPDPLFSDSSQSSSWTERINGSRFSVFPDGSFSLEARSGSLLAIHSTNGILLQHSSGSAFFFDPNGDIQIISSNGAKLSLSSLLSFSSNGLLLQQTTASLSLLIPSLSLLVASSSIQLSSPSVILGGSEPKSLLHEGILSWLQSLPSLLSTIQTILASIVAKMAASAPLVPALTPTTETADLVSLSSQLASFSQVSSSQSYVNTWLTSKTKAD